MEKVFPVQNPDTVTRRERNEALLFNPSDGNILCINETAMLIWDLCDGTRAIEDIIVKITGTYEVPERKARDDCLKYLKDLEEAGFIAYKA